MTELQILLAVQVALLGALGALWKKVEKMGEGFGKELSISEAKLSYKIDKLDEKLSQKIDKLDEKLTDVDRRLCRLEGAFASKDCCMIKDDRHPQRQAE